VKPEGYWGKNKVAAVDNKVRNRGLGLRPRLYAGPVCDDGAAEAAYAAIMVLCK